MDNIQELKRKHNNIKHVLKKRMNEGKDVTSKVDEYVDICKRLNKCGVEVKDFSPLIIKALEMCGRSVNEACLDSNIDSISKENMCIGHLASPKKHLVENIKPSTYKIVLAWTEKYGNVPQNTIQIIDNYLKENGAKEIDSVISDFDEYKEVTRCYEWSGEDAVFTILRRSANYILDIFAENQYEKFNISIFGNKKKN